MEYRILRNETSKNKRREKKPVKKRTIVKDIQTKSILEFLTNKKENDDVEKLISNRASLFDEYLLLIDKDYFKSKKNLLIICSKCNIEKTLIQSEGLFACQNCGEVEHVIIESEIPSHKDLITDKPKYPYKKINHLIEKLNQFQSKETTNIPDDVYNRINIEMKKRQIDINDLTPIFIKHTLKKYRLTQYYEHLQYIFSRITKIPPPTLTREEEEDVKNRFRMIEEPYNRHRPNSRSNFLNYSFVIRKIFLIINKPTHARYFNLLKSKEKLKCQDKIWNKICIDLKWPFHSSL